MNIQEQLQAERSNRLFTVLIFWIGLFVLIYQAFKIEYGPIILGATFLMVATLRGK